MNLQIRGPLLLLEHIHTMLSLEWKLFYKQLTIRYIVLLCVMLINNLKSYLEQDIFYTKLQIFTHIHKHKIT